MRKYIVHNPKGILNFQNAKIKEIKGCEFTLAIKNELNSSGNPIFLKGGTKVIGITQSLNKAYFIGPILNYFQNFQDNNEGHGEDEGSWGEAVAVA